jgi:hypothetical protein
MCRIRPLPAHPRNLEIRGITGQETSAHPGNVSAFEFKSHRHRQKKTPDQRYFRIPEIRVFGVVGKEMGKTVTARNPRNHADFWSFRGFGES